MREWGAGADLPVTDEVARTNLALPMSPVLSPEQAEEVCSVVRSARLHHQ
jgi:dTDP-4-amino-4,6-dideoxygalactose transaminase